MDRSWIHEDRLSEGYRYGVEFFLSYAQGNSELSDVLRCPCQRCGNLRQLKIQEVRDHLFMHGFDMTYKRWIWHGESTEPIDLNVEPDVDLQDEMHMMDQLRCDAAMDGVDNPNSNKVNATDSSDIPLYPGCKNFSKTTALIRLFNLKACHGWTNNSFGELLELIHEMLPEGNLIPTSMHGAKKEMSSLGLKYKKIHACRNDCMIYYDEYSDGECCPKCGASRWKSPSTTKTKVPAKAFWYLPIIPRFRRLFLNQDHARALTWHKDGVDKKTDLKLRHPVDAANWRNFDATYPDFSHDPRNLRLGLCTDGINPFNNQSTNHSSWPVVLVIYNLPPWMIMKRRFMHLCLMISGPKQPGNKIDTYLRPLIDDLKTLWHRGVDAYDGYRKEAFTLRAALLWTVSDYPAYGNLSGAVTKGYCGCAICGDNTNAIRLRHGKKMAFMGHRKWLPPNHPFRRRRKAFNGLTEFDSAPRPQTYTDVTQLLDSLNTHNPLTRAWKRKCIFFELPYWGSLMIRHNLDVMHIEKNVCESLLSTLMNVKGKSKDSVAARLDMIELGIRGDLAPIAKDDRLYLPPACYIMSNAEKRGFCEFMLDLKLPEGYSSNLKSKVNISDLKLQNMKSHDWHVLIQQILPVALRGSLNKEVRYAITKLCYFFNQLCSKVVDPLLLEDLQRQIVETLCSLEMYFPPSFFDVMVHISVHLIREVQIGGPVFLRWMYPFERYMKTLKSMVKSKSRPEASMVECYIVEEAVEFCSEYVSKANIIGLPDSKNSSDDTGRGIFGPRLLPIPTSELNVAHLYVLRNMAATQAFVEEHFRYIDNNFPEKASSEVWRQRQHANTFAAWLKSHVNNEMQNGTPVDDTLRWLSSGPQHRVLAYEGFIVNGYRFHTAERDKIQMNQNSGVTLIAESMQVSSTGDDPPIVSSTSYFGVIEHIWELDYIKFRIPLFKCKWFNPKGCKVDDFGFTIIDCKRIGFKDDPFILASQAKQVFYLNDRTNSSHKVVLGRNSRFTNHGYSEAEDEMELVTFTKPLLPILFSDADDEPNWLGNGEMEVILNQ